MEYRECGDVSANTSARQSENLTPLIFGPRIIKNRRNWCVSLSKALSCVRLGQGAGIYPQCILYNSHAPYFAFVTEDTRSQKTMYVRSRFSLLRVPGDVVRDFSETTVELEYLYACRMQCHLITHFSSHAIKFFFAIHNHVIVCMQPIIIMEILTLENNHVLRPMVIISCTLLRSQCVS